MRQDSQLKYRSIVFLLINRKNGSAKVSKNLARYENNFIGPSK